VFANNGFFFVQPYLIFLVLLGILIFWVEGCKILREKIKSVIYTQRFADCTGNLILPPKT
jgi:SNF family Na+-dependent transporter